MVSIRSVNEIILNLIDFFKLTQPDLDTKPGTVARDLFIDAPATQISLLYDELSTVSNKQSLRLVNGSDLDKLAKNFGVVRVQPTKATGVALLTFSSINSPININSGGVITSSVGVSFSILNSISVSPNSINYYRSVASKFRDQLDIAGISDTLAVEVTVIASSPGSFGNIGKYSLNRTTIPGVSNVTNVTSFTGGADQETDSAFRTRVLSTFAGSSVGTALGYQNAALSVNGITDAVVIEPGNPLMTRDGTETQTNADGSKTIINEGSGGKVDVVVLGSTLQQTTDSFIYRDKSNNNDPTDAKNNFVLGQISGDENKTINRKRIDNIANNELPAQPVNQVLQVTGSLSGSNFIEKSIDSLGRVTGNYEIIKDTGVYGGSPWGFDTFRWISNKISLFEDSRIKSQFNGQDPAVFTGLLEISKTQQLVPISNEDSEVTTDRSIIRLLHTPATSITRVFNVNTGERYVITNPNLDNTGQFNTSGRIKISGNTLPSPTDVLQVDYNWVVEYDQYNDFDGLTNTSNIRPVTDSIDWGYASAVKNERIKFTLDNTGNFFNGTSSHPINTVVFANKYQEVDGYVFRVTSGTFVNRLAVLLDNLPEIVTSVESVKLKNYNSEQYATDQNNGDIINNAGVSGINIVYDSTIVLPTDATAVENDKVTVIFNSVDVYHSNNNVGSSTGTLINIPSSQVNTAATEINLLVSYIAEVSELFSSAITSLPSSRLGNGFSLLNNNGFNNSSIVNLLKRESQTVQLNFSNEFYVDLSISSTDYALNASQVLSVVRLSDGLELWNSDNKGTIIVGSSGNYQLILTGYNTPATSDRVMVLYYSSDIRRFQPFTYQNNVIKYHINEVDIDPIVNKFTLPLNRFSNQSNISFDVLEPNTDIKLFSITDGYIINNGSTAIVGSSSVVFGTLPDLLGKKVKIYNTNNSGNNGLFDIISYNTNTNAIGISSSFKYIDTNQVSVIRLLDGKEIWNSTGTIDIGNDRLILPSNITALQNDKVVVVYFNYNNLKRTLPRLTSNVTDQANNSGTIIVSGTSITKAANFIFTATNTGLKLNLSEALRKALALNSTLPLPSNIKLARIVKLEKVTTASSLSDEVVSVLATYDLKNTKINNNLFYLDEHLSDLSLGNLDFILPSTQNNILNGEVRNLPTLGDKLRVTFYYMTTNDSESISYTTNGTLYTNKKFALIDKVYVNSGFKSSSSARVSLLSFTQPNLGARYTAFYDYLAPKTNERISINYNYNKIISDVTFSVERSRPVNADVIVREAKLLRLDLTMNVVIDETYLSSTSIVLQTLRDKLVAAMKSTNLGGIIDQITLINIAQGVAGIARARILYFNKTGVTGQVLKITAQDDEYFTSNNLIINTETR